MSQLKRVLTVIWQDFWSYLIMNDDWPQIILKDNFLWIHLLWTEIIDSDFDWLMQKLEKYFRIEVLWILSHFVYLNASSCYFQALSLIEPKATGEFWLHDFTIMWRDISTWNLPQSERDNLSISRIAWYFKNKILMLIKDDDWLITNESLVLLYSDVNSYKRANCNL